MISKDKKVKNRTLLQYKEIVERFLKNNAAVLGLLIIIVLAIMAIFPGLITSPDYISQDLNKQFQPPSKEHFLGTDEVGRDMLTRIVWGARTSLSIGIVSVLIACVVGVFIGLIAGYYGGKIDNVLMRLMDVLLAIPNLLLGISMVAALGRSTSNLTMAIALGTIAPFARVARSSVMTVKDQEYIESAKSTGAGDIRVMSKYVFPNALSPIIVQISMSIANAILTISGLSFIGLGVAPPTPEWGSMLSVGRGYIRDYWWVVTFPGVAIMLTVFAFNLLGDGLRDALDPRLRS